MAQARRPYIWEYQEDSGEWTAFDAQATSSLEEAYVATPTNRQVQVRSQNSGRGYYGSSGRYEVNFMTMKQTNTSTSRQRSVRRVRAPDLQAEAEEAKAQAYAAKNSSKLNTLFNSYADPESSEEILEEGTARICADLGVEPEDAVMLVISYHMRAQTMCVYTREEFCAGMGRLGCSTMAMLKRKVPQLREALSSDAGLFAKVYDWSFSWVKDPTQKGLAVEYAIAMWPLLLQDRWEGLPAWLSYVETHRRPITKDEWDMLLQFIEEIRPDLSNYDDSEIPWPVLFDDFVEAATSS